MKLSTVPGEATSEDSTSLGEVVDKDITVPVVVMEEVPAGMDTQEEQDWEEAGHIKGMNFEIYLN